MALIDGKIYSKDKTMLTLTNEEYKNHPGVEDYKVCITRTHIFAHYQDKVIKIPKGMELPMNIKCPIDTITTIVFKSAGTVVSSVHNSINYQWTEIDPQIGEIENEFYSPNPILDRIVYNNNADQSFYFQRTTGNVFNFVRENDSISHLFNVDGFFASAFRNSNGDLILTEKKIIKCEPWKDHLMVKYEGDDEAYLILLCYSSFYEIPLNTIYPGDATKSARKI